MERKRNASDGDSGFDSALSSRSSSISLEESQDLLDFKISKVEVVSHLTTLTEQFADILNENEDIYKDVCNPSLYIIRDRESGSEIMYKPPSKLSFSSEPPRIGETFSAEEYNRCNPIPRSQLFNARLQLELEKQVAKMDLLEVNLLMDNTLVPPPSLGIRVIGVNMIHGVPDKLNIYVKRVMEGSVAGLDNRIKVNDHIVEVNGVSLIGVSQKLAAEALSSCAVNPETGVVNFVLARAPSVDPANKPTDDSPAAVETPFVPARSDAPSDNAVESLQPPLQTMHEPSPVVASQVDRTAEDGCPAARRKTASSTAPDLLIAAGALHCGESTAFLPLGPDARPRLTLSDLPAPILTQVSSFLSARDRISLSKVNKSFYAVLKHESPVSAAASKAATVGRTLGSCPPRTTLPRSMKKPCSSKGSEVSLTSSSSSPAPSLADQPRMVPCV